ANGGTAADGQWPTGFSKLGSVGNAIGTVPASASDIDGGMDPTKAIVSESAGTAGGLAVGTWAGSAAAGALAGSGARGRNSRRFRRGRCCRRGNRLRSLQERAMHMVVTETNPPPPVLRVPNRICWVAANRVVVQHVSSWRHPGSWTT